MDAVEFTVEGSEDVREVHESSSICYMTIYACLI